MFEAIKGVVLLDRLKVAGCVAVLVALGLGLHFVRGSDNYYFMAVSVSLAVAFFLTDIEPLKSALGVDLTKAQRLSKARSHIVGAAIIYAAGLLLSALCLALVSVATLLACWLVFVVALAWLPVTLAVQFARVSAEWGQAKTDA